jgi:hypothetical protein
MFDMVVNGGVTLTVNYKKDTYMTLQRSLEIPQNDYTVINDIVMTAYST